MRILLGTTVLLTVLLAACSDDGVTINETSEVEAGSESATDVDSMATQNTLVARFAGKRFVSVENLEIGQNAEGSDVLGKWRVSFTADVVSWDHSDVVEVGTYFVNDDGDAVAMLSGQQIPFSADEGDLEWDSRAYLQLSSSTFDSQETAVDYLNGSSYVSVEEQDIGENASGGIALGDWSIEFNDEQYTWNVQDTVLVGAYTFAGESTLALANGGQDVSVYFLTGDRLLIDDVEYARDQSARIDSQQSLVSYLDSASYQSAELQEIGESSDGSAAMGYWYVNFMSDTFDWSYQDVQESGTYSYVDGSIFTAESNERQLTVELQDGDIIWDGLRYTRQ